MLFISFLWTIRIIEYKTESDFGFLGIYPRKIFTLPCILTAPLIHGNFFHLISNTLPLLILGITTFFFYRNIAFDVFLWIYLLSGLWVWVGATPDAYHIGSSGIVYGFVAFLFFSGLFRRDPRALAIAVVVALVYGSLIWGIFPMAYNVSWEYHLFGALAGSFCAYFYRRERGGNIENEFYSGEGKPTFDDI
jgi:membrane associated rhomboid family serine protease